ncbi:MAG: acyltransferase family protein, partial [Arthrobacter sp.]
LLLLGVSQAAALQLARPALSKAASAQWVRTVVGAAGRRAMTVYLWHLPLLAAMSGLILLTDIPKPAAATAAWWWSRPIVLVGVIVLLLPVLALFGRLEERPAASVHARSRPALAVVTAGVVVFVPVADAALNGLTLALLGGGAACFALAVLLLGRMPAPASAAAPASSNAAAVQAEGPLPRKPLSANVEP